ncbi:uncharacterized protein SCHCODRAFT_02037516 [Schizophyllum commune H4-8]|nr:uncharacterized protein SCHCODRAFT_02037516 [Schizophyllum commune H4-8]KAI5900464.1 hypothetical protein SCHCODRAFT_02037516 [Schizophyllum commune H4-8]
MAAPPTCSLESAIQSGSGVLSNFGQEPPPHMHKPIDLGTLRVPQYSDHDVVSPLHLRVLRNDLANHWWLEWPVGTCESHHVSRVNDPVRRLQVVQERCHEHLTNWGGITVISTDDLQSVGPGCAILLGIMDLVQRQALERIAVTEPVLVPNGEWNCQNWTISVLQKAVDAGFLDRAAVDDAVMQALAVPTL